MPFQLYVNICDLPKFINNSWLKFNLCFRCQRGFHFYLSTKSALQKCLLSILKTDNYRKSDNIVQKPS